MTFEEPYLGKYRAPAGLERIDTILARVVADIEERMAIAELERQPASGPERRP